MNELRLTRCLIAALVIISCTIFVWTVDYITAANTNNIPIAITAFNG